MIIRVLIPLAGALLVSGCSTFFPSRAGYTCDSATNALRVHDSRIEAARSAGSFGFTANLASRSYATYHCSSRRNGQIACVMSEQRTTVPNSAQVTRLLRERSVIETRVARACQI